MILCSLLLCASSSLFSCALAKILLSLYDFKKLWKLGIYQSVHRAKLESKKLTIGQFLAELGFKDYHRVISSTNYSREGINSKKNKNIRSSNRLLAQLVTSTPPCRTSSASNRTPANYFKNIFKLKIDQIIK